MNSNMHQSPRKSLFEKLETMNLVREIDARREWIDDRLLSVPNVHPSLMHYTSEGLGKRADGERSASKKMLEKSDGHNRASIVSNSPHRSQVSNVSHSHGHSKPSSFSYRLIL